MYRQLLIKDPKDNISMKLKELLTMTCSVARVLDFWICDPCLDFINVYLDFSSLENYLTFHAYQTMCSLFQNHSLWY